MREQKAKAQAKKANYEIIPAPCPAHQNRDMNQNTPPSQPMPSPHYS